MLTSEKFFDSRALMKQMFRVILILIFTLIGFLTSQVSAANEQKLVNVRRGFSIPLKLSEDAGTVAIGDPNLLGVTTIKPNLLMINGQETGTTSLTVFAKSGNIYEYQIIIGNDISQLRKLISLVEKKVIVEDIDGTIVLRGEVATAAALTRVLSIADRYVSSSADADFRVISDKGGVLAGNLEETRVFEPPLNRITSELQTIGRGGRGGGAGGGSNGGSGGGNGGRGAAANRSLDIMEGKGNLAQNLNRADVVAVANGKVLSLIKVAKQPKVEIQMRIVAVDRAKTDQWGLDWRLDGNRVTIGSRIGGVTTTLPSPSSMTDGTGSIDPGTATLVGFFRPGNYFLSAFLRAVEEKGAAKTLSEPLVTAVSGESASFLVGGSIPIPTQDLSPGNATSNAVVATRIEFIRFGLQLVVRPTVLENGKISIVLDQSISEPDYANAIQVIGAAIPAFRTKYVSTITESESGETWAVAGLLTEEDSKNLKSVPWISKIPVIGWLFQNKEDNTSRNELMILVNARTIDGPNQTTTTFDGIGNLAPSPMIQQDGEDSDPEQPRKETDKNAAAVNSKPTVAKPASAQNSLTHNQSTAFTKSKNTLIKPSPVAGRTYKEIVPDSKQLITNSTSLAQ